MAVNLTALAAEINADPKALGYGGKSDYAIAVILNTPGASGDTLIRAYTDTADLTAGLVAAEVVALSQAARDLLVILTGSNRVKTGDSTLRATLAAIFAAGTTSRTNLIAAASRSCSRAEFLFGEGETIADAQVARALRPGG